MDYFRADYINGVLYELENGETSKPSSKEDWDSAITFTARTSGEKMLDSISATERRVKWQDPIAMIIADNCRTKAIGD